MVLSTTSVVFPVGLPGAGSRRFLPASAPQAAGLARFSPPASPPTTTARGTGTADGALPAWEDPGAGAWREPFMIRRPDAHRRARPEPWPDPAPLLLLLTEAGARIVGPRLLDGRFVLEVELGNALVPTLVLSGRTFRPEDGVMAKLRLGLPLEAAGGRFRAGRSPAKPTVPTSCALRANRSTFDQTGSGPADAGPEPTGSLEIDWFDSGCERRRGSPGPHV